MSNHRHIFDSRYGYTPGHMGLALMCRCGNWGMSGGGEWQAVPTELLPRSCRWGSRMRTAARILRNCVILLVVGLLWAWFEVPGAFK